MGPCAFCQVTQSEGFNIVYEDETFVAFQDHKPAAVHHIQVIPKRHIKSVKSLQKQDLDLVINMKNIGDKLLDDLHVASSMRVMGFHIPPFNSVNHLHLHVHGLPYKPLRQSKYPISAGYFGYQKGFSWFIEVNQVLRSLEQGRNIHWFPC
ncbi:HIT-like protein [Mycena rebaudengoi]|nr:HIT-like protein [Mycena rebaudengoi]